MKIVKLLILLCFSYLSLFGAVVSDNCRIGGTITDVENGELLPGATLWFPQLKKGALSNAYGYYSILVPPGKYRLEISYTGYQKKALDINIRMDSVVNWKLMPGLELSEITVSSSRARLNSPIIGANFLSNKTIEVMPVVLGEPDVLKTIQSLPGVKGGNEGTAGIQVRGGSHDQNLILLDGIPVYNTNHLFGYLSTFNADVIKDVKFYKGSIPARYGGRLSSVIDISVKEGDLKKHSGKLSISPVAGSVMIEGPLKKDTASYLISMRRSWLDIPLRGYNLIQNADDLFAYSFYDLNGKINWIVNDRNRFYLSHYQGQDRYLTSSAKELSNSKYSFEWGNYTTLLRWNHLLSPSLFVNTSVYHSLFRFMESTEILDDIKYVESTRSSLDEISLKSDFDLSLNDNAVKFGYHISNQSFKPELIALVDNLTDTIFNVSATESALTFGLYAEDEWELSKRLTFSCGGRMFAYRTAGKTSVYWEPKFASSYKTGAQSAIKLSAQKMTQAIHLLTNTALNMPTDLWVPATENVLPATSWQFDVGFVREFKTGYSFTLEAYYKSFKNVIQYKQGISFLKNNKNSWQEMIDVGEGINYGTEVMLEKTEGKLTGWMNYTLAWAKRKVDGINQGEFFPFKYDRRHDINLLMKYALESTTQKRRNISCGFKLASGNAITIPIESYEGATLPGMQHLDPYFLGDFETHESFPHPNNYRMPVFHHLDLAYSSSKKLQKGRERTWKYSVYNVYNQQNPYFYVKRNSSYYQISMLPIIPSVSFTYKW